MAKRESILESLQPADEAEQPAKRPKKQRSPTTRRGSQEKVYVSILYGEMTIPDIYPTTEEEAQKITDAYRSIGTNDEEAFLVVIGGGERPRATIRIDASVRAIKVIPKHLITDDM